MKQEPIDESLFRESFEEEEEEDIFITFQRKSFANFKIICKHSVKIAENMCLKNISWKQTFL